MNQGTIIRTILAIALVINSGVIATGVADFENPTVDLIYKILSFCATVVILFVNTYYNNDYTEEGKIGTLLTRQLKAENNEFVNTEEVEAMGPGEEDEDGEN